MAKLQKKNFEEEINKMKTQYFEFGEVYVAREANESLEPQEVFKLLEWHGQLKRGELGTEDREANWYALKHEGRILSRFRLNGTSYYVITEPDRSYTTIMEVDEY